MGSQPTKKFSPAVNTSNNKIGKNGSSNKASSSSSPVEFDSAYESLYSAFTSPSGTISSSNTSSPTSTSTCLTSDTFSIGKFNPAPLMDPLTLNTVDDLPSSLTNCRSLASIRLEPIELTKQKLIPSSSQPSSKVSSSPKKRGAKGWCNGSDESAKNHSPSKNTSRFTCHRKSYPMSIGKKNGRIDLLPPLESVDLSSSSKTLPFKEYKRWLVNFRNKSSHEQTESKSLDSTANSNGKLFQPKIRCQTATLRLRRNSDQQLYNNNSDTRSKMGNISSSSSSTNKCGSNSGDSSERIFTISDKSYLNSGKSDLLNSNDLTSSGSNGKQLNKSNYQQRKSSIVTMNCFNSDLVHGGSNTVFDLNALNDALTKPRNKVAPAAVSLLSVNHLKSTAGIF